MKNRGLLWLVIVCLALSFSACGNETKSSDDSTSKDTSTEQAVKEEVVEDSSTSSAAAPETADQNDVLDHSLSDVALIQTLSDQRPEKLLIESEMTAFNMTTKMKTYYNGKNSRTEVDIPDMAKSILIHLADENVMYQYVYGEASGVKMTGANTEYAEEIGLMMDSSMLAEITEASSKDITAKVDMLGDEEVVYVEATQSDEDMGEVLVKMWYSNKYATPLKYQVIVGDTTMADLKVTNITDSVSFDDSIFLPPSDVTFEEMAMETLMED